MAGPAPGRRDDVLVAEDATISLLQMRGDREAEAK